VTVGVRPGWTALVAIAALLASAGPLLSGCQAHPSAVSGSTQATSSGSMPTTPGSTASASASNPSASAGNPPVHLDLAALTRSIACPITPTTPLDPVALAAFAPVTALRCQTEDQTFPGDGEWLVAVRQVAVSGVAGLQEAYELPSQPRSNGVCSDLREFVPAIALVSASGVYLVPTVPHNGCGQPLPQVLAAQARVGWRQISVIKQQRVQ
jgi:hypothetical protein